jgi:signal transduction histidine kinase/ActR/RegA family two-component response regulator
VRTRGREPGGGRERFSRTLSDIAQVFESAEGSVERVLHVVALLRQLVPYDQCALLEAAPGREPCLVLMPPVPPDERDLLTARLMKLFGLFAEEHTRAAQAPMKPSGAHLAVPLLGLDEVIGVLFVRLAKGAYQQWHRRPLSVIGAKLAAYLTMLRARAEAAERTRQLEEARRGAETANRAKDEFLALVSHELKTPLSSTLTWAHVLRSKGTGEAERARAVEAIERNVRAQAKLIDDLLDLSCIATAELRLDLRAVEPVRLIKAAIETLRPQAERRSIRLDAALDRSVKLLSADPDRLEQVVATLLANAIKSTPNGGHIEVHLERAGADARIQVIDNGKGISRELLPHVFEPFREAESSSTRSYGGFGAGLAIVKHLVELHGGRVRAESPGEEKGTTFTVVLPLTKEAAVPEAAEAGERSEPRALTGIRIVIVDDDRDMCDALQYLLESYGAEVTAATSAAEALAALECSRPDVLLSDVAMPGESGYDLMRKIAAREGGDAPPAVALSSYVKETDRKQAIAAGFRTLVAKPIDPEALVALVVDLAGGSLTKNSGARP